PYPTLFRSLYPPLGSTVIKVHCCFNRVSMSGTTSARTKKLGIDRQRHRVHVAAMVAVDLHLHRRTDVMLIDGLGDGQRIHTLEGVDEIHRISDLDLVAIDERDATSHTVRHGFVVCSVLLHLFIVSIDCFVILASEKAHLEDLLRKRELNGEATCKAVRSYLDLQLVELSNDGCTFPTVLTTEG